MGVDTEGRTATSNRAAEALLEGMSAPVVDGTGLPESLGIAKALKTGRGEEGIIRRVNGRELVINTRPVLGGRQTARRAGGLCSGRASARPDP